MQESSTNLPHFPLHHHCAYWLVCFGSLSCIYLRPPGYTFLNPLYPDDECRRHPYGNLKIRMTCADVIASGDFQRSRLHSINVHPSVTFTPLASVTKGKLFEKQQCCIQYGNIPCCCEYSSERTHLCGTMA